MDVTASLVPDVTELSDATELPSGAPDPGEQDLFLWNPATHQPSGLGPEADECAPHPARPESAGPSPGLAETGDASD